MKTLESLNSAKFQQLTQEEKMNLKGGVVFGKANTQMSQGGHVENDYKRVDENGKETLYQHGGCGVWW